MKPKKLTMSAFCPYSSEVEIDFDAFGGSGLFLITGETGAGKTTIFDGISFALFGEVSGENRGTDMLRSDFAKPDAETFVKLVFEDKGEVYEIIRNPRYIRPVKRGDSGRTTTQNADAEIRLPNNDVITGAKEVTEKVISLLGINHRQFKQISMVAQGEFLKLLFADSKDRGEIFRKVFGTELYEKIQRELKNKMLGLGKQLDGINSAILQYNEGIICDGEDENYCEYLNLRESVHGLSEIILLLKRLVAQSIGEKKEKSTEVATILKQINARIQAIAGGEQINELIEKLEKETQRSNELKKRTDEMADLKIDLELGKKAIYLVKPQHDEFKRLETESNDLESSIKQNQDIIKEKNPIKSTREKELERLKSDEPQREVLATEIQNIENSLPDYETLDIRNKSLKTQEDKRNETKVKLSQHSESLKINKIRVGVISEELKPLKDIDTKKLGIEHNKEVMLREKEELADLGQLYLICMGLLKKMMISQKDFENKEETYNSFSEKYDLSESLFYREQAGILAEKLVKNFPCPVCGSLNHPNKAKKAAEAPTQEKLTEEKNALGKLRNLWQKSSETCGGAKTEYVTKMDQLKKDSKKLKFEMPSILSEFEMIIDEREKELEKMIKALETKQEDVQVLCNKKLNLENEQIVLQESNGQDETEVSNTKEQLSKIDVDLSTLKAQINALKEKLKFENKKIAEYTISQKQGALKKMKDELINAQKAYQSVCDSINEAMSLGNADSNRLKTTKIDFENARKKLNEQLKNCGFADLYAFEEAILSENEIDWIEAELKKFVDDITRIQSAIQQLKDQLNGRIKVDISVLSNEKACLTEQQGKIQSVLESIEHVIKNNETILESLKIKQKEREETECAYSEMKMLSDTANGDLRGKQKLPFEQYVQGVYFDMVLSEANKRFGKMTDNRYSLIRKDGGANNQNKSGLEIDVEDKWTLKRRSVKSLSGGESFKASLSLALGLSDIVQNFSGGVQLNAMFIDEGFGSLDSESLEKAMDILAGLTEGNRLVGIISHLDELKEKIDKRIIITRDPQGSGIRMEA